MNVSVGNRRLAGKSAIVTGAGKGIGRAIAERFAEEGADLIVVDVNADALARTCEGLRAHGVEVIDQVADMTAESAANLAAETALSQFGKIDILINNVGGNTPGRIWEMPVEEWDRIIAFNLRPTLLCTRAVAPAMIRQRAGHIVCISSGAREGAPWLAARGAAAYSTCTASYAICASNSANTASPSMRSRREPSRRKSLRLISRNWMRPTRIRPSA
jgi:NAD(P)-dependent dehydrogenase (short-subunit alcohol dehydrogenase family)